MVPEIVAWGTEISALFFRSAVLMGGERTESQPLDKFFGAVAVYGLRAPIGFWVGFAHQRAESIVPSSIHVREE